MRIIGLSGSLRTGSYNAALLRSAAEVAPDDVELEMRSIRGIPLYDADVEGAQGVPGIVEELKDHIAAADGLLLVTPEYNHSIPGVFKNAVDWLSRPPKDIGRVFGGKPVGVLGATPGRAGTRYAQTAWLSVLQTLGTRPWFGATLAVDGAARKFDEDLRLVDETVRRLLTEYMAGFAGFVREQRRG